MKTNELSKLSVDELQKELENTSKELFNLNMQKSTGQLAQNHLIKNARRNIARINAG